MSKPVAPFSFDTAWDNLKSWAESIVSLFGSPAEMAAALFMRRRECLDILEWLAPLEAGVRRLLLIEAVKRGKSNEPPLPPVGCGAIARSKLPNRAERYRRMFGQEPDFSLSENSADWRVSFRVWPAIAQRDEPPAEKPARARKRVVRYNAIPLARRIEAVMRVLENPAAYITEMARRIYVEPDVTRFLFFPHHAKLHAMRLMLIDIHRETELALEKLDTG